MKVLIEPALEAFEKEIKFRLKAGQKFGKDFPDARDLKEFLRDGKNTPETAAMQNSYDQILGARNAYYHNLTAQRSSPHAPTSSSSTLMPGSSSVPNMDDW